MSPILLIHGLWCHPEIVEPLETFLKRLGHEVHCPALPGHAPEEFLSDREMARVSLRDCVDHIRGYIAKQQFSTPPLLIGHSMGGLVAQMVAAEETVDAVILLNSAGPAGINHIYPSSVRSTWNVLVLPFFWRRTHRPGRRQANWGMLNRVPEETAEKIYPRLRKESGRIFFELVFWFLDRSRTTRIVSTLDVPMLIVSGGMDRIVLPRVARALSRRYPLADFRSFPASGHWLFHEVGSERVFSEIADWIGTIPGRRSFIEEQTHAHHDPGLSSSHGSPSISSKHPVDLDRSLDRSGGVRGSPDRNAKPGRGSLLS